MTIAIPKSKRGEPVWELAQSFPTQGNWTEDDFFDLDGRGTVRRRLHELSDGNLEVLPMPSPMHQRILLYVVLLLREYVLKAELKGEVLFAPMPVLLFPGTIREPDILFYYFDRIAPGETYPRGADLVMEIVSQSPEDRKRDLVTKKQEYAQAGISEYWIIDPFEETITVLMLPKRAKAYKTHGEFQEGDNATSKLLKGFSLDVSKVLQSANPVT